MFGKQQLSFLSGEVKGYCCLQGVSIPTVAALTDDSDQWRDEEISNKPFKNQLAAEQVLFGFLFQPN